MDRTLFSPSMIDVFRGCPRAFSQAFRRYCQGGSGSSSASKTALTKSFLKHGLAEINKGKVCNISQVQTFVGEKWPLERLEKLGVDGDAVVRAFLHCYKILYQYVRHPYRPTGSEVAAVGLKVRGRAASARVYIEDTFDLVLWYPVERHLEIVDFQVNLSQSGLSHTDSSGSTTARHYLIKKLQTRWSYASASFTTVSLNMTGRKIVRVPLMDETLDKDWQGIESDLGLMKVEKELPAHSSSEECVYCNALLKRSFEPKGGPGSLSVSEELSLSA